MDAILHYLSTQKCQYRRTAANFVMTKCLFHDDRTPSMSVTISNGAYRCFSCGTRGDLVDLIEQLESVGFAEANAKARQLRAEVAHG
jgi:DNA primase